MKTMLNAFYTKPLIICLAVALLTLSTFADLPRPCSSQRRPSRIP